MPEPGRAAGAGAARRRSRRSSRRAASRAADGVHRSRRPLALAGADRERLAGLLATLPDRYRIAVVLRHVDDLSYPELADVLGRPEGTVKAQVPAASRCSGPPQPRHELEELTA